MTSGQQFHFRVCFFSTPRATTNKDVDSWQVGAVVSTSRTLAKAFKRNVDGWQVDAVVNVCKSGGLRNHPVFSVDSTKPFDPDTRVRVARSKGLEDGDVQWTPVAILQCRGEGGRFPKMAGFPARLNQKRARCSPAQQVSTSTWTAGRRADAPKPRASARGQNLRTCGVLQPRRRRLASRHGDVHSDCLPVRQGFDGPLNSWHTSSVRSLHLAFSGTASFGQDVDG